MGVPSICRAKERKSRQNGTRTLLQVQLVRFKVDTIYCHYYSYYLAISIITITVTIILPSRLHVSMITITITITIAITHILLSPLHFSCPAHILPSHNLLLSSRPRLYSSAFYDQHMVTFQPPEIATTPLEDLLLQVNRKNIISSFENFM